MPEYWTTSSNDLMVLSKESIVSASATPAPNPRIMPRTKLVFGFGEVGLTEGKARSTTVALIGETENAPSGVSSVWIVRANSYETAFAI